MKHFFNNDKKMKKYLKIITSSIIIGIFCCVGLELSNAYDQRQKFLKEMELIEAQKKSLEQQNATLKIERERYEKQILLITKELENERIKNQIFKRVQK